MAAASGSAVESSDGPPSSSNASNSHHQQPPPPFFIQTFSEQIERAYLRYRARSTLQKQYRQLLSGADPDSLPPLGRKRVRKSEDDPSSASSSVLLNGGDQQVAAAAASLVDGEDDNATSSNQDSAILPEAKAPHIDDVYRLDLSVAKPDAGILAIGDPPNDVYLPPLPSSRELENRQIIQILLDKTWESDTLFYDLEGLTHDQIKELSQVEWSRELPAPPPFYNSLPTSSSTSSSLSNAKQQQQQQQQQQFQAKYNKRKLTAAMVEDERDLDEEIEYIKRSFCDKSRAHALAARGAAAAAWWWSIKLKKYIGVLVQESEQRTNNWAWACDCNFQTQANHPQQYKSSADALEKVCLSSNNSSSTQINKVHTAANAPRIGSPIWEVLNVYPSWKKTGK